MSNTIELCFQVDTADDFAALCELFDTSKAKAPEPETPSTEIAVCFEAGPKPPCPASPGAWMWDAPREPDGETIEAGGVYCFWEKMGLSRGRPGDDGQRFRRFFTTEEGHARFAGHWTAICRERRVSINGQPYRVMRYEAPRFENAIVTYDISVAPVKPVKIQTYNAPGGGFADAAKDAPRAVERLTKALAEVAKQERREREAPLVALVNDVPEGLDPIGWRAAVLAFREALGDAPEKSVVDMWFEMAMSLIVQQAAVPPQWFDAEGHSLADVTASAYRRAIAPSTARPHVETRHGSGVAFRSRSKGLPLDMGDG